MYFRELPNPVCTFHLYDQFVDAAKSADDLRLVKLREVVFQLPPPNYRLVQYTAVHCSTLHKLKYYRTTGWCSTQLYTAVQYINYSTTELQVGAVPVRCSTLQYYRLVQYTALQCSTLHKLQYYRLVQYTAVH